MLACDARQAVTDDALQVVLKLLIAGGYAFEESEPQWAFAAWRTGGGLGAIVLTAMGVSFAATDCVVEVPCILTTDTIAGSRLSGNPRSFE